MLKKNPLQLVPHFNILGFDLVHLLVNIFSATMNLAMLFVG